LSIEEDGSDGEEAEGGQAKGEEGGDVQVLNDLVEQLDGQAEEGGRSSIPVRSDGRSVLFLLEIERRQKEEEGGGGR